MAVPFGCRMRIPEDRQQFVSGANFNIFFSIFMDIIKIAFFIAVIASFGALEEGELDFAAYT